MNIVAEIPARYGSKRVKQKNLRLINGKPLIYYAIDAAKHAKTVNEIYVNSESDIIGKIAFDNGVKFYKRAAHLAEDAVASDLFNYDFMKHVPADIVVMVNPVGPLVNGEDIDKMVNHFLENDLDTLIPVREIRLHSFYENKAINFNPHGQLPMTQNIEPVRICAWTVCIWRTQTFIREFEAKGHAVFSGKMGFYAQGPLKSVKISNEEDFTLAEILLNNKHLLR